MYLILKLWGFTFSEEALIILPQQLLSPQPLKCSNGGWQIQKPISQLLSICSSVTFWIIIFILLITGLTVETTTQHQLSQTPKRNNQLEKMLNRIQFIHNFYCTHEMTHRSGLHSSSDWRIHVVESRCSEIGLVCGQ